MNVMLKHVVEITIGIVLGTATHDAIDKFIDVAKAHAIDKKVKKGAK